MSVFKTQCLLFLRNPRGGVEDLDRMLAAGFGGVFCNIGDHTPEEWEAIIRPRALQRGMTCGPWLRTTDDSGKFLPSKVEQLIECAMDWEAPFIVNSESELQGTGDTWTTWLRDRCAGYDWALSMEPQPFDNVQWWVLGDVPVLPQCFTDTIDAANIEWYIDQWHAYGISCVFPTFGTYGKSSPGDYSLNAPYSLFTADDCGGDYAAWTPTAHSYEGCVETPPTPIPPEDDMTTIGTQDGVTASCNRLRDMDPGGTLLVKQGNKWPDISTLTQPIDQWKAYDKLERALTILVEDHDAAL